MILSLGYLFTAFLLLVLSLSLLLVILFSQRAIDRFLAAAGSFGILPLLLNSSLPDISFLLPSA